MSRIVCIGPATEDIYLIDRDDLSAVDWGGQSVFSGLKFGAVVDIDKVEHHVGGHGLNTAVGLARFGHEVVYMGSLAQDVAGEAVSRCLDEENIDSSYVDFGSGTTGTRVLLVDAKTGDQTELSYIGTAKMAGGIDPKDIGVIEPDWVYVAGVDGNMQKALEIFEATHAVGGKVMWRPGPAELKHAKKVLGLLGDVDVLLLDKESAARLVPGVVLAELLSRLSNYCKTVIITDGVMGSIATDHTVAYRLGIYEQGKIKDLNGADDAFGAGFLAKFAENEDFAEALQYGSANAAKVMQHYGAEVGMMSGKERLHQMPIMEIDD